MRITIILVSLLLSWGTYTAADVLIREHHRCWDETLGSSHGGWVSQFWMAQKNCERAKEKYPDNEFWIETEQY